MCGIYGSTKEYLQDILELKMQQFRFRGPDMNKMQVYSLPNGQLVLGHNRLAILDLDKRAVQPMEYAEGNIVVVLNGEIYNYLQLKQQFFSDKVFHTTSDTEVLCMLYERFGSKCVNYINGDFAFVVYDKQKNILFGAVDRLGVKPFYYHHSIDGFEFCSQLLPLCIGNKYGIDEYSRQCYFSMQYIPSPYSIIKQIKKLNPGECFTYSLVDNQLEIIQYWDLYDNTCNFVKPRSFQEAKEQTLQLLDDAVGLRLKADVGVGVFLSGGIDSSTVALLSRRHNVNLEAFSVGFKEDNFDESVFAREVANQIGIRFKHIVCTPIEALEVIDGLQKFYDEPMGDASAIPTSLLCEKAGNYIKVALGGDGGDEMFFGYPRYLRYAYRAWTYKIPMMLRNGLALLVDIIGKKREAVSLRMKDVQQLYMNRRPSNKAECFDALQVQQSIEQCKYLYQNKDLLRAFNDFDIKTLMCHAYNVKVDRASMRANLEVRVPMLDYRVVEYSRLLPIEYCYNKQEGQKLLLRDILYDHISPELFKRKKQGFGVPIGAWFQNELRDLLIDSINPSTVDVFPDFDANELIRVRDRHISGVEDQTTLIWLCFNYVKWHEIYEHVTSI